MHGLTWGRSAFEVYLESGGNKPQAYTSGNVKCEY